MNKSFPLTLAIVVVFSAWLVAPKKDVVPEMHLVTSFEQRGQQP